RAGYDAVGAVGDRLLDCADHRRDVDLVRTGERRLVAIGLGAVLEELAGAAPVRRVGQRVDVPDVRLGGGGTTFGSETRDKEPVRRQRQYDSSKSPHRKSSLVGHESSLNPTLMVGGRG